MAMFYILVDLGRETYFSPKQNKKSFSLEAYQSKDRRYLNTFHFVSYDQTSVGEI